jgi:hypothetical protein
MRERNMPPALPMVAAQPVVMLDPYIPSIAEDLDLTSPASHRGAPPRRGLHHGSA